MRKAYDTFLQSEVSSDLAAQSGGTEPYRYECAHCGEEVRLAAVGSIKVVPHFKHRSGNNEVECEEYLGQYGAISIDSHSRKSKNERAEFYFDKMTKMFYLGLCFSDNEISTYEQLTTNFELRAYAQERAFFTLSINNRNFDPDIPRMIPIEKFSYNYYLSNTLNGVKRKYEVFKNNSISAPTFFKILGKSSDFKSKLVRSSVLYTNVPYFVVFQNLNSYLKDNRFPKGIEVECTFKFETMGRKLLGKVLTIKTKNPDVDSLIMSWGYQLEASETLTLLWPPTAVINDVSVISSNCAFLFSSFELQAHGNINVHADDIAKFKNGISKVLIRAKTKIYRKNAEISIEKGGSKAVAFDALPITVMQESLYMVSEDSQHFLLNSSGITPLNSGQIVSLTQGSQIRRYYLGYLNGRIYPLQQRKLTGVQLLKDILAHNRRIEAFSIEDFNSLGLSEVAFQYIERCKEMRLINSAVKKFIEEGRL